MVEIQVRHHDMPYVFRLVAQRPYARRGALTRVQAEVVDGAEHRVVGGAGPAGILADDAGVDQHQAIRRLQQQAMAGKRGRAEAGRDAIEQRAARGLHGAAVQVVDVHGGRLGAVVPRGTARGGGGSLARVRRRKC